MVVLHVLKERERERESVCVWERESERKRAQGVNVCRLISERCAGV